MSAKLLRVMNFCAARGCFCCIVFFFALLAARENVLNASEDKTFLRVAAAADLQWAMPELAEAFSKKISQQYPQVRIDAVYGSSGNFAAQIRTGKAPFNVFFSADAEYPRMLADAGLAAAPPRQYAQGRIVLWTTKHTSELAKVQQQAFNGNAQQNAQSRHVICQFLMSARIRRIAIANPAHAPYGKRAEESLRALSQTLSNINAAALSQQTAQQVMTQQATAQEKIIRQKLVFAENVAQAAQYIRSGAADCGIVALSLVCAPQMQGKGAYMLLDSSLHAPIRQSAVTLKRIPHQPQSHRLAEEFLRFVCTDAGARSILAKYGFQQP